MHLNLHSHPEGGEGVYCPDPGVLVTRSGEACQRAAAAREVCDSTIQVPQEGEPGYTDPDGDFSFWAPAQSSHGGVEANSEVSQKVLFLREVSTPYQKGTD